MIEHMILDFFGPNLGIGIQVIFYILVAIAIPFGITGGIVFMERRCSKKEHGE